MRYTANFPSSKVVDWRLFFAGRKTSKTPSSGSRATPPRACLISLNRSWEETFPDLLGGVHEAELRDCRRRQRSSTRPNRGNLSSNDGLFHRTLLPQGGKQCSKAKEVFDQLLGQTSKCQHKTMCSTPKTNQWVLTVVPLAGERDGKRG